VLYFLLKKKKKNTHTHTHIFCGDHVEENLAKPSHKQDTKKIKNKKIKILHILGYLLQPIFKNMAIWKSLFSQIW
jgi:hypothetical protein